MRWSDWKADWNNDVLARIVALLFALANLADLAAGCSVRRRQQVLGFLIRGEAEARAFVIGMASDAPIEADEPAFFDNAASLAARLRVLAFMLWFLLAQAGRFAGSGVNARILRRKPAGRSMPAGLPAVRNRRAARPAPDT
jgi:hypothetical protein